MSLIDCIMLISDVERLFSTFHNGVRPDIVDLFSAEMYAVPIASPHPFNPLVVDRVPHMKGFLLSTDSAVRVRCTLGTAPRSGVSLAQTFGSQCHLIWDRHVHAGVREGLQEPSIFKLQILKPVHLFQIQATD